MIETIVPSTDLRGKLQAYVDAAARSERIVITVHGRPKAVLVGFEDYRQMKVALEFAKNPEIPKRTQEGFNEIMQGRGVTLQEALQNAKTARSGVSVEGAKIIVKEVPLRLP